MKSADTISQTHEAFYARIMGEVLGTPPLFNTAAHTAFLNLRNTPGAARLVAPIEPMALAEAIEAFERNGRRVCQLMFGVNAVEAIAEMTEYSDLFDVVMLDSVPCTIGKLFGHPVYSETLLPQGLRNLKHTILLIPGDQK